MQVSRARRMLRAVTVRVLTVDRISVTFTYRRRRLIRLPRVTGPGWTSRHRVGAGAITIALAAIAVAVGASPALASRAVRYHGYSLTVPSSWRVINLARAPRHVRAFQSPRRIPRGPERESELSRARGGPDLRDPARAAARRRGDHASATRVAGRQRRELRDPPRAAGRDRDLVRAPAALVEDPSPPDARRAHRRVRASAKRDPRPRRRPGEAGWRHSARGSGSTPAARPRATRCRLGGGSPYRAVGIYIGGVNEGCSQPNLTAGWVSGEVGTGWQLIPTYVGLQGKGSCDGRCSTISSSRASSEGASAARDAVANAQALGIPAGNPIYDDMEAYTVNSSNTAAVLAFLSGWTKQLHTLGYVSGVYSSAASGITALVRAEQTSLHRARRHLDRRLERRQDDQGPLRPRLRLARRPAAASVPGRPRRDLWRRADQYRQRLSLGGPWRTPRARSPTTPSWR